MELACRFSHPANDYFALAVGETGHSTGEVRREAFFYFVQRNRGERLAFELARPTGKRDCRSRVCRGFILRRHIRHKRRDRTGNYVEDSVRAHCYICRVPPLQSNRSMKTSETIPIAS